MKKILLITLLLTSNLALADSNTYIVDALITKGILTEEEGQAILKEARVDKKTEQEKVAKSKSSESPVKFYGLIRTFVDHDNVNTPVEQPDVRVTSFISKFGIKFKEPISYQNWVVNGQYETLFQSDNPRSLVTWIGDQQSTIGLASNADDNLAVLKIDIGRKAHSLWNTFRTHGIFNDSFASPVGEIHARQGLFFSNGVYLQSKNLINGLTLNFDYNLSERVGVRNKYAYGATYEWSDYSIAAYRFDDDAGNNSTLLAGSVLLPQIKSKISSMLSKDTQKGGPFPIEGISTTGFSTQLTYYATPDMDLLVGYGHRNDGVDAYTAGVDYKLNARTTLQLASQFVKSDDPLIYTTANDIGPLFGINGGSAAGTGTNRTQVGLGLRYKF
jgi:predicted porin